MWDVHELIEEYCEKNVVKESTVYSTESTGMTSCSLVTMKVALIKVTAVSTSVAAKFTTYVVCCIIISIYFKTT
jgi:hypothetical protein